MEYQKIKNVFENTPNNHVNLEWKFGLKKIMTIVEDMTPIVKSHLKFQCYSLVFVIIVMHKYLLTEP